MPTFACMHILYLFNPSHDEALASGSPYYCPSKTARRVSAQWATLPALWASNEDYVCLPDEVELSTEELAAATCKFVRWRDLKPSFWQQIARVEPWGWDPLVAHSLARKACPASLLPTDASLQEIRQLSSRESCTQLLPALRLALADEGIATVGESFIFREASALPLLMQRYGRMVLKSLWSCSGRGVFSVVSPLSPSEEGRVNKLLREQGGVEAEPYYEGVLDFALEFQVLADGSVAPLGISMFHTSETGGYLGNAIAPQSMLETLILSQWKMNKSPKEIAQLRSNAESLRETADDMIGSLQRVCSKVISTFLAGRYVGMIGIDMMLVKTTMGTMLHPCIELNLRRTMGHVAIALQKQNYPSNKLPKCFRGLFSWI